MKKINLLSFILFSNLYTLIGTETNPYKFLPNKTLIATFAAGAFSGLLIDLCNKDIEESDQSIKAALTSLSIFGFILYKNNEQRIKDFTNLVKSLSQKKSSE